MADKRSKHSGASYTNVCGFRQIKKLKNSAFLTSQKRSPRHSTWRTLIEFDSFFRMYEVTAACVGKKKSEHTWSNVLVWKSFR